MVSDVQSYTPAHTRENRTYNILHRQIAKYSNTMEGLIELKIKDPTSFQQLSKEIQQAILHSLRVKGASISQLQRITGLGKGFIQRT